MGKRLSRIAVLGATALVLGLIAAPAAHAQAAVTCLDLATFTEEPATIVGTNGNDLLRGTPGRDVIPGLDGNDLIVGLGGDDAICGGRGNERSTAAPAMTRSSVTPGRVPARQPGRNAPFPAATTCSRVAMATTVSAARVAAT